MCVLTTALAQPMPGTTGLGVYWKLMATLLGRLGARHLGGNSYRVRVEPASGAAAVILRTILTRELGWKQPGDNGQDRFSTVVSSENDVAVAVLQANEALRASTSILEVLVNQDAPERFRRLIEQTDVDVAERVKDFAQSALLADMKTEESGLKDPLSEGIRYDLEGEDGGPDADDSDDLRGKYGKDAHDPYDFYDVGEG